MSGNGKFKMTGSNEVLVSPKYSRNTDGKKAVNRRTVQIFIWVCVTINLVALACVAVGFFSTWHFEYEYKEKVNNVMTDMEGHYGFWKICYSKKGEKGEMCVDTKGFGPPFDELYDYNLRILIILTMCLFLPSVVGGCIAAMSPAFVMLAALCAFTVLAEAAAAAVCFGIFTWRIEDSAMIKTGTLTYSWSFMVGWIGVGILLILFLFIVICTCCYKCLYSPVYNDDVDTPSKGDGGIVNTGYIGTSSLTRESLQQHDSPMGTLPKDSSRYKDENFHYQIDNPTFMQYGAPRQGSTLRRAQYRQKIYDIPETVHQTDVDPEDIIVDVPGGRLDVPDRPLEYHTTVEVPSREIPITPSVELSPDYPESTMAPSVDVHNAQVIRHIDPARTGSVGSKTFTISRIRPSVEMVGTPLDIGDTYVVSLNK